MGIELPRDEKLDDDIPSITYDDVEALAAKAKRLSRRANDAALVHVPCYSGPRIGEATALRVCDLDLEQGHARINRTWTVDREGKRKLGPPKTWEKRWIPLPSFLLAELRNLCSGKPDDGFVFQTPRGEAINDRNWYNSTWTSFRADTAAATMSVHDMRHVAATLSIAAGADVKLVQQMLGHKDANETLNTYAHLWPSKFGEVISLVEARREKAVATAA